MVDDPNTEQRRPITHTQSLWYVQTFYYQSSLAEQNKDL